jgi:hypothetical protein
MTKRHNCPDGPDCIEDTPPPPCSSSCAFRGPKSSMNSCNSCKSVDSIATLVRLSPCEKKALIQLRWKIIDSADPYDVVAIEKIEYLLTAYSSRQGL